jgi:hypothetical protein
MTARQMKNGQIRRFWLWSVCCFLLAATCLYVLGKPADAAYFIGWACFAELRQSALSLKIREREERKAEVTR